MSSSIYHPVSKKFGNSIKVQRSSGMKIQCEVDTRCGFWIFKPACLQPLAKVGVFATFYSFTSLMTQTLVFYVNSQILNVCGFDTITKYNYNLCGCKASKITTLEKQFGFSSKQTGIILAANDVGYLVCVLFVAYIAPRVHIPRALGIAVIIYGISGIACSLPHFLFGAAISDDPIPDLANSTSSNFSSQRSAVVGRLCDVLNASKGPCQLASAQKTTYRTSLASPEVASQISLVIIVLGMALQGFGKAPRGSFNIVYLDDNTAKVNTGFYAGIIVTAALMGPAVAFFLGGIFSRMYVTLEATPLTPRHPKWIGAWWLGYMVFGLLSLVVAVPLFCFPRKMPRRQVKDTPLQGETLAGDTDPTSLVDKQTLVENGNETATKTRGSAHGARRLTFEAALKHCRKFMKSLYRLFTNLVYISMVIYACFLTFVTAGNYSFFPKYLEMAYQLPTHTANYITSIKFLCTSSVGAFTGGYLSKRLKLTALTGLQFTAAVTAIGLVFQTLGLAFRCEQPTVHNWPGEEMTCSSECNCRDNSYFPICGVDGRTYYSPCHAGCLQAEHEVYHNCSCISGFQATGGTCDHGCSHLYGYVVISGLRNIFISMAVVPLFVVFIRLGAEYDGAMALSAFNFLASIFGWLLSPIIFGMIIDSICRVWDYKCLTRGRCLLYDNDAFRVKFHGYGSLGLACALFFLLTAYLYARWTRCLDAGVKEENVKGVAETTPDVNDGGTVNT